MASSSNDPSPSYCVSAVERGHDSQNICALQMFYFLLNADMRRDVQDIFRLTPHEKQCMMFSATLSKEIRPVCRKFMQDPMEVYVDDETKLTLHGLQQYYCKLKDSEKNRKLFEPARRARVQPDCAALCDSVSAAGGAELPCNRHPQRHGPGGEAFPVPAVQGLPKADPGGHQPVWPRDGH
uniref:Uncharacterized protein n=1 Tax=Oncorhynchus tshawytscha TaxID=74940 RepID=A0AAZ3PU92_ONCTS